MVVEITSSYMYDHRCIQNEFSCLSIRLLQLIAKAALIHIMNIFLCGIGLVFVPLVIAYLLFRL